MNTVGSAVSEPAELRRSLERTLREVFGEVLVLAATARVDYRSHYTSLLFVASRKPLRFERDPSSGRPVVREHWAAVKEQFLPPSAPGEGALLTDAFNPVESMSAPAFRDLRRSLLSSEFHRSTL